MNKIGAILFEEIKLPHIEIKTEEEPGIFEDIEKDAKIKALKKP